MLSRPATWPAIGSFGGRRRGGVGRGEQQDLGAGVERLVRGDVAAVAVNMDRGRLVGEPRGPDVVVARRTPSRTSGGGSRPGSAAAPSTCRAGKSGCRSWSASWWSRARRAKRRPAGARPDSPSGASMRTGRPSPTASIAAAAEVCRDDQVEIGTFGLPEPGAGPTTCRVDGISRGSRPSSRGRYRLDRWSGFMAGSVRRRRY